MQEHWQLFTLLGWNPPRLFANFHLHTQPKLLLQLHYGVVMEELGLCPELFMRVVMVERREKKWGGVSNEIQKKLKRRRKVEQKIDAETNTAEKYQKKDLERKEERQKESHGTLPGVIWVCVSSHYWFLISADTGWYFMGICPVKCQSYFKASDSE